MLILCDLLYAVPFVASDGEISSTETRPSRMAVKNNISFLDKYNPEQCEIVGTTENGLCDKALWIHPEEKHNEPFIDGKKKYTRILIKRKPAGENGKTPAAVQEALS